MNDQLNFGTEYVSAAEIIRNHYKAIGAKGGKTVSEAKRAAGRRNVKIANACRLLKRMGKTVV